jgi:hypothetical protein
MQRCWIPLNSDICRHPSAVRRCAAVLRILGIAPGCAGGVALHRSADGVTRSVAFPTPPRLRETPLPVNLRVPDVLEPLVRSMWERSPTFRRQCARLGQNRHIIASIELAAGLDGGVARLARDGTRISGRSRRPARPRPERRVRFPVDDPSQFFTILRTPLKSR